MVFNSYIFIMAFLPVLIIGYYLLNKLHPIAGKIFLAIGSALFYLYGGYDIALILLCSIVVNYLLAFFMSKWERGGRFLLILGIVLNVGILFYFKYFNFFMSNIYQLRKMEYDAKSILLPLGISFFTFQQIMYLVNIYRKELRLSLLDYIVYILYFPKLLMGPIAEPASLIEQFNDPERKKINWDNVAYGLQIFSFGLFKKLVLADTFTKGVSWGFSNLDTATSMDFFLVTLFYTFEIYFDFSGYSDMAVGVSSILNIDLPMNFDSPYKALSIGDFWKRWHISLTGFLRKYIYFPLGGSRKGKVRTYLNIMIIFLVSGIWHGANWTFILWGAVHGLLSVTDRLLDKPKSKIFDVVKWAETFLFVNLLWLLFRADSISQWWSILKTMFAFQDMSISNGLIKAFVLPETTLIMDLLHMNGWNDAVRGLSLILFTLGAFLLCLIPENNYKWRKKNPVTMILSAIAFIWGFLCLSSESVFVYFNF